MLKGGNSGSQLRSESQEVPAGHGRFLGHIVGQDHVQSGSKSVNSVSSWKEEGCLASVLVAQPPFASIGRELTDTVLFPTHPANPPLWGCSRGSFIIDEEIQGAILLFYSDFADIAL